MDGEREQFEYQTNVRFAEGSGRHCAPACLDEERARLDEDVAELVHDLKNPLSTIALEVDLIDTRLDSEGRCDLTQALGRIRRNVSFIDGLIIELAEICMAANGHIAARRARCDLQRLLASVIDRVVPSTDRPRVVFDTLDSGEVVIDQVRIERVIANLLDNALKYTPADAEIHVSLTTDARFAQVSVCDNGPGLEMDELEVVFQPYQRAASSRGCSGSGLGLHVSKQIVEEHGGYIGVDSVRGAGARFFFALPLV
jgi:signal transduction histidine kinase